MLSVKYHSLFDYKLIRSDFPKWQYKDESITPLRISASKGQARLQREKISKNKLEIARNASKILSFIPSVKMMAVTGSLAMENSADDSDIDLMIITKKGTLWTTRLFSYLAFSICHLSFRRSFDRNEKDKLCLNMWLDESDLVWKNKDRNLYTSHEIAQIVPLVNKNKTYEKFLYQNKWILNFWPSAVKIVNLKLPARNASSIADAGGKIKNSSIVEKIAYKLQYAYMQNKITRETITPTRALFHPQDWGEVVLKRLK